jgi:hypothetical protein
MPTASPEIMEVQAAAMIDRDSRSGRSRRGDRFTLMSRSSLMDRTAKPRSTSPGCELQEFWDDWTTDPLWLRPAKSTNVHNRERTSAFVETYGDLPMRAITD